jgi:hypothetical protein
MFRISSQFNTSIIAQTLIGCQVISRQLLGITAPAIRALSLQPASNISKYRASLVRWLNIDLHEIQSAYAGYMIASNEI